MGGDAIAAGERKIQINWLHLQTLILPDGRGQQYYIMNWIILIVAGCFETGFAFCLGKMKEVSGVDYWLWGAGFLISLTMSMALLSKAVQTIPIGTAYPVWTGIGAVGTVLVGIFFFHEPATFWRIFFLVTLIASIVGLKTLG